MWAVSRNRQAWGNAVSTASGRKKVVLEKNLRKDVFIWLMVPADTVCHGRKATVRSRRRLVTMHPQSAVRASYRVHRQTHLCLSEMSGTIEEQ